MDIHISVFRSARDTHPDQRELPLEVLAELLAPGDPPVERCIAVRAELAPGEVDRAWTLWHRGDVPQHRGVLRWYRQLEIKADDARAKGKTDDEVRAIIEGFHQSLRERAPGMVKAELPAWSPARYPSGATRKAAAVEVVSSIVLDIDDGTPIDEVTGWIRDVPLLLHTSWSHTDEQPKCRVILPLARPVPVALWPRVWQWASDRSRRHCDKACKDPSRLYFLPAVKREDAPYEVRRLNLDRPLLRLDYEKLPDPNARKAPPRTRPLSNPSLPPDRADWLQRKRLKSDPETRREAGLDLGGKVEGQPGKERIIGVTCPQCGEAGVWWYLDPPKGTWALCNHRNTCGWGGPISQLLGGTHV